jgi:hypothetical protein
MRSTNLNQLQKNTTKTPTKTAPVLGVGDNYPQDLAQALLRIIKTVCASAQPIPMVPKAAWACLAKSMESTRARTTLRTFAESYTSDETTLDSIIDQLIDEVKDTDIEHFRPNIWRKRLYQTLSRCRGVVRLLYTAYPLLLCF